MLPTSSSTSTPTRKRGLLPAIALLLAASVPALAQNALPSQGSSAESYSTFNVDLFLGYQHFLVPDRDAARVNSFNDSIVGVQEAHC